MTFKQLISICRPITVSGPEPEEIGFLTQDSRSVKAGAVFIAVEGTRFDGHRYIGEAVSAGASVVVCEDEPHSEKDEVCFVQVADTRSLLGPLAQAFEGKPAENLKLTGITGTNGKTTVATLTYQVLRKLGARPSLLGTVDKRIGDEVVESRLTTSDPIELARDMRRMVEAGSGYLVMEVSSHALDQQRTGGLDFKVAAFTNLSHDHLDYHSTLQEYARSKKQLFDGLDPESWAVVNADDKQSDFIVEDCRAQVVRFSFQGRSSIECEIISGTPEGLTLNVDGVEISSPLAGSFNAYNVAQTFLICRTLGFEDQKIATALADATGAAGRLERVGTTGHHDVPVVFVDYAHTPDALENVLMTLSDLKADEQSLHVIFGCGGNRDTTKRPKMAAICERYADQVIVTSDNPRDEDPEAIIDDIMKGFKDPNTVIRMADRRKAIEEAVAGAGRDTIILVAGKGHETYQEIKGVRHPFDDREVILKALGPTANANSGGGF